MGLIDIRFLLDILFLAFTAGAFFTMLHLLASPTTPQARLLRIIHRATGGISVALFVIVTVLCIEGLRHGQEFSPVLAVRFAFGSLFVPMTIMKSVIVEKYPELRNRLFSIGTIIFAAVFVMFLASAFSLVTTGSTSAGASGEARESLDLALGKDLFVVKCAKCHRLDRALSARLSPSEWEATVEHMRQKDPSWISETEAGMITGFLVSLGE
jgi:mono/diheme cytochrome c family protein